MPNTLANLARQSSTTIGTGTLTLGPVVQGFNTFAAAGLTDGQTITYAIEDYSSDIPAQVVGREIGQGVYSAGTVTRTTVYSSTNGGTKINCSGRQHVLITAAAEDFAGSGGLTDGDYGDIVVSGSGTVLSIDSAVATTFGRSLMDDADASAGRTTLGLGSMATETAANYLTTAAASSTYQPLDADLTAIAALTTAAYGRGLLETTSEANFKATVNLEIGVDVQAYDAELAAIAGLTSAADKLPYFTGSGTAALADITTFGRSLIDDAAASNARTTLGLGTAATQNTGTSGANIPLLNAINTFSANQFFSTSSSNTTVLFAQAVNDDAVVGPIVPVFRDSASAAAFDAIGRFSFDGRDSAGNYTAYGGLSGHILDPTDGSEDGRFVMQTVLAGSFSGRLFVAGGAWMAGATGGDKGSGTFNATAVYDDSVLLCAPVEFMKSGTVNTSTWDAFAIDEVQEESVTERQEVVEITLDVPEVQIVGQRDGTYKKVEVTTKRVPVLDEKPVLDDKGDVVDTIKVPRVTKTVTPAKTIKRRNELAHEFKAMLDGGFDPRDPKAYFDKMLADEALPGLKTKANWVPNEESNAKRTNRIILALELQTAVVKTLYERLEALEAKVNP